MGIGAGEAFQAFGNTPISAHLRPTTALKPEFLGRVHDLVGIRGRNKPALGFLPHLAMTAARFGRNTELARMHEP